MKPEGTFRPGTLVAPRLRLDPARIAGLHRASMQILDDPGAECYSAEAAEILSGAGCAVTAIPGGPNRAWRVRYPERVVRGALEAAPARVVLGARDPANRLLLEADVPRVYFGTGSETNFYLRARAVEFIGAADPGLRLRHLVYRSERGSLRALAESARLCNALPNVDFFIRNVNVQDPDLAPEAKDANVVTTALAHTGKHVQVGLSRTESLDEVLRIAAIVAGGEERLRENPVLSFITCLVKSPLQMVEDSAAKLVAIARRGVPVVISSSPQGGSTAPISEEGMVALINAEILAGITLAQAVNPGTPVLYGAVPVRARLDNLHDLYGAPEFVHYNVDCVQMARSYGVPCYSSAGVGDAKVPGMQATVEKVFAQFAVPMAGAQYVHYAFGLLDKTNVFSPLQAVLDDAHVGIVRQLLREPAFGEAEAHEAVAEIRKVMASPTRLFARHIRRAQRRGLVSPPYPFESRGEGADEVLLRAQERLEELLAAPGHPIAADLAARLRAAVPALLPPERLGA